MELWCSAKVERILFMIQHKVPDWSLIIYSSLIWLIDVDNKISALSSCWDAQIFNWWWSQEEPSPRLHRGHRKVASIRLQLSVIDHLKTDFHSDFYFVKLFFHLFSSLHLPSLSPVVLFVSCDLSLQRFTTNKGCVRHYQERFRFASSVWSRQSLFLIIWHLQFSLWL